MKPLHGFAKVVLVQFWRDFVASCMDWLRWVRQASSLGSDEVGRKTAPFRTVMNIRAQAVLAAAPI